MSSSQKELQTKQLTPRKQLPLTSLHILLHLRWEREWYETFETRRARLLNLLSRLNEQMNGGKDNVLPQIQYFSLGGQTALLEDITAVRPDLVSTLAIYNGGGRLSLGPWYVNVDEALVSGEALVRNLLTAQADATKYNIKLSKIAFDAVSSGHVAQLPQILRGFGVVAAFLKHGAPIGHMPFRWRSTDGSSILVVNLEALPLWDDRQEAPEHIQANLESQKAVRPEGPFAWIFDPERAARPVTQIIEQVKTSSGLPVTQNNFENYVRTLRHELPDNMRPSLRGELRMHSVREHTYLHPGTLSTRIYLKQANARAQSRLLHDVEPWLTVALTHGTLEFPQNVRALMEHAWRTLLKNQSTHALRGTGTDAVHLENELRYQQVEDAAQAIITETFNALPGIPHSGGQTADETYIMVWNAHNWSVKQVVEQVLDLPDGRYPATLTAPDGGDVIFGWEPESRTLSFLATVEGLGYAAYTLTLDETPLSEGHNTHVTPGQAISNGRDTVSIEDGVLVWRQGDRVIPDVLRFFDGGDAGDAYNYAPPEADTVVTASLTDSVQIESGPLYERMTIRHRMRVAVGLRSDRSRSRGLHLMELVTTVTVFEGVPGVYFHTTFENTARDHRLRAHIRTGIDAASVLANSAYMLVKRSVAQDGPEVLHQDDKHLESACHTQPAQQVVAVVGEDRTLSALVNGLPEYEALPEDGQLTLALTLVRSVGWLSRQDVATRTALVAPAVEVPGAQVQRKLSARYALVYTTPGDRAAIIRAGRAFDAPLQTFQYDRIPQRKSRSYLSVMSELGSGGESDGSGAIVTAFKPPERGRGWMVRLFNPHSRPVEIILTPHERPSKAYLTGLNEAPDGYLEPDANGRVTVVLNPHEIITARFVFA